MLVSFASLKSKRLALSQRVTRDEERRRHDGVTVLPFFREHCTLTTTLEMGKICSNHLHFLSYLLKCPVDNAGNGVSEPLNLKIFWRSMPPDGDPPYFGSPSDFQLFSFAYTFKLYATPLKFIRILKTCFSRQFQDDICQVSHYQPSCHFYGSDVSWERLETQLTILKMHAHECSIV